MWLTWSGLSITKWFTRPKTSDPAIVNRYSSGPNGRPVHTIQRATSGPAMMTTQTNAFCRADKGTAAPECAAP